MKNTTKVLLKKFIYEKLNEGLYSKPAISEIKNYIAQFKNQIFVALVSSDQAAIIKWNITLPGFKYEVAKGLKNAALILLQDEEKKRIGDQQG